MGLWLQAGEGSDHAGNKATTESGLVVLGVFTLGRVCTGTVFNITDIQDTASLRLIIN